MSSSGISLVVPLVDAQRSRKTGSKAVDLSRLITARFAVPRGFVISADAYRSHLWASGARAVASAAQEAEDRERIRSAIIVSRYPGRYSADNIRSLRTAVLAGRLRGPKGCRARVRAGERTAGLLLSRSIRKLSKCFGLRGLVRSNQTRVGFPLEWQGCGLQSQRGKQIRACYGRDRSTDDRCGLVRKRENRLHRHRRSAQGAYARLARLGLGGFRIRRGRPSRLALGEYSRYPGPGRCTTHRGKSLAR